MKAEPDIVLSVDGWRVGVAVKRVTAISKLTRRISEAADQIQASRFPGIIIIFCGNIVLPRNQILVCEKAEEAQHVIDHFCTKMLSQHMPKDKCYVGSPSIVGVWCIANCPVRFSPTSKSVTRMEMRKYATLVADNDARRPKVTRLVRAFAESSRQHSLAYWVDRFNNPSKFSTRENLIAGGALKMVEERALEIRKNPYLWPDLVEETETEPVRTELEVPDPEDFRSRIMRHAALRALKTIPPWQQKDS